MYPKDVFLGMDFYDIFLVLAFLSALIYFRIWADKRAFSASYQNLVIVGAMVAIFGGYGSAVLAQAFYDYLESGEFAFRGATFYGGLVGGAAVFLLVYFVAGHFLVRREMTVPRFFLLSEIAAGAIAMAHGLGRIGCLFAGCCHGAVTDAWYGIYNAGLDAKTVPLQLFEALFLFALAAYLTVRLWKGRHGNLGLYLALYAVWRFVLEFFRTDRRGQSPIAGLSPSQFTAALLVLVGVGLWVLEYKLMTRAPKADGGAGDA